MDFLKRREKQLKPSRPVCHHNFRPPKGIGIGTSAFGKSVICVVCICEKIEDALLSSWENENPMGNGNETSLSLSALSLSSSTLNELMHNIRLINTSLENQISQSQNQSYTHQHQHQHQNQQNSQQELIVDGVLPPTTIKSVIDTFAGLLRLPNDEIGLTIAQGVEKICPKITPQLREYLMEKVSSQMQDSLTLTIGGLECLRFVLQSQDILILFLEQFGQNIVPKLLHALRSTTTNTTTRSSSSGFKPRLLSSVLQDTQTHTQNSQSELTQQTQYSQSQSQNWFLSDSLSITMNMKAGPGTTNRQYQNQNNLRVMSIYSILDRIVDSVKSLQQHQQQQQFSSNTNTGSCDLFAEEACNESKVDVVAWLSPSVPDLISNAVGFMKEGQSPELVIQILEVLAKVFRFESSLSAVFKSGNGYLLCTSLKRMLLVNYVEIQKMVINVVCSMLLTYVAIVEGSSENSSLRSVSEFPGIMSHIDLVHTISQVMATSNPELFGSILHLLSAMLVIPELKPKLATVLESGLRVASILISSDYYAIAKARKFFLAALEDVRNIPTSLQQQIVSVCGKLPEDIGAIECLEWTKLLAYCSSASFLQQLIDLHCSALKELQSNEDNVVYLKRFLLLTQVILNCKENRDQGSMAYPAMDVDCDVDAESIMQGLMRTKSVPAIMVFIQCAHVQECSYVKTLLALLHHYPMEKLIQPTPKPSISSDHPKMLNIKFINESSPSQLLRNHNVNFSEEELYDTMENIWSSGVFFRILVWIRSNMELIKNKPLYDMWNQCVAQVVLQKYPVFLPSLPKLCSEDGLRFIIGVYESLDLDMGNWKEIEFNSHCSLQVEGSLAFSYFYSIFNMSDPETLHCGTFLRHLNTTLQNILGLLQQNLASWDTLCFYFKTALLIICCQNQEEVADFVEIYENLVCLSVENICHVDFEDAVTFCSKVFSRLISWNLLSDMDMVDLMEKWLSKNPQEFEHFFLNQQPDSALRIQIIDIACFGSGPISKLMVEVTYKKRVKLQGELECRHVFTKIINMKPEQIESEGKLSNYHNLLAIALVNAPALNSEIVDSFPSEVYLDLVTIFTRNHRRMKQEFGLRTLKFLLHCFKNLRPKTVLGVILDSKNLSKILRKQLAIPLLAIDTEARFEMMCVSYEMITLMISITETCWDDIGCSIKPEDIIHLKLSSLVSSLTFTALNDATLALLTELLRRRLTPRLVKIEETDPIIITGLLDTFCFLAQNMISVAFDDETKSKVWNFLSQLLRFSCRKSGTMFTGPSPAVQSWIKLLLVVQIIAKSTISPLELSVPCLKFLLEWAKHALKQKGAFFRVPAERKIFNLGSIVHELYLRMSSVSSSSSADDATKQEDVPKVDIFTAPQISPFELGYIPTTEKVDLIKAIARICNKLRDPSIKVVNSIADCSLSDISDHEMEMNVDDPDIGPLSNPNNDSDSDATCSFSEITFTIDD